MATAAHIDRRRLSIAGSDAVVGVVVVVSAAPVIHHCMGYDLSRARSTRLVAVKLQQGKICTCGLGQAD